MKDIDIRNLSKCEKIALVNSLLDVIEYELDKIAISVGHPVFKEWIKNN